MLGSSRGALGPLTDGTGVNYPFHEELWPQLEQYFAALSQLVFGKYKIPRSAVKVIRIGMDKTGEFNYPYSEVLGGGETNNTWWAFDSGGTPYRDYPAVLVSVPRPIGCSPCTVASSLARGCFTFGGCVLLRVRCCFMWTVLGSMRWFAGKLEARPAKHCRRQRICRVC